jgi:adhesin/invasin
MLLNKVVRTPKNQVSTPRPECGVGFDSSARAMNRDTKENVSLVSFERKQMLNTLKRKIALVAVSAVGMSGLALMSAPAANAAITAISAVTTQPQRALTGGANGTGTPGANSVVLNITAAASAPALNTAGLSGETVTLAARVRTVPTAAANDSVTAMAVGDTLGATSVFLQNGVASAATLIADSANNFNAAGTYGIFIWVDSTANNVVDGNEAGFLASVAIGSTPASFALSAASQTVAGTAAGTVGITLKDANSIPTLLKSGYTESITAVATMVALSTDTITVRNGTSLTSNNLDSSGLKGKASLADSTKPSPLVFTIGSTDSITASTGSYNIAAGFLTGATSATISINLGGALDPVAAQVFTLTAAASGNATKAEVLNTTGITVETKTVGSGADQRGTGTPTKYAAPTVVETPTATTYQVTTSVPTVSTKIYGTAGSVVNVTVSGTAAGITAGVEPITIGADGTATITKTATAATDGTTIVLSIPTKTADLTSGDIVNTYKFKAPAVSNAALGSNGISTDVLSTSVSTIIQKTGATTAVKVTVVDQYNTPKQYYSVAGTLGTTNRNYGATITTVFTDANGQATLSLTDASTSTTNLSDVLTIQVAAPGTVIASSPLLASGNALTINYSATGIYASLAVTGGTTATTTVTRNVETSTGVAGAEVTLVPVLKDSLGNVISGVGLVYTGSDGVYFRTAALTRPSTGDVTTLTRGSAVSVFAYATKPGTATVTITGGGLTTTQSWTVSAAGAATARNLTAVAAAGRVTATVKDGWGNPVAGVTVSFAADSKGVFGNGTSSTSAATDASGTATAVVQSADGTGGDTVVIASHTGNQSASLVDAPVTGFTAAVASATVTAKPTAGAASTDTAITAVKTDVATANAAVKALATQVTVLQASVATLIDSLTTQIASLMKSVSALTKAVAKLQAKK